MKIRLLFDHPHSYREWTAEPLCMHPFDDPAFVRARSEVKDIYGRKQSFDLVLCQGQFEVIEP